MTNEKFLRLSDSDLLKLIVELLMDHCEVNPNKLHCWHDIDTDIKCCWCGMFRTERKLFVAEGKHGSSL